MLPQLVGVKLKTPVEVTVQVYNPSRRHSDKSNMYAMSAKFLYDAMTYYGCQEDDSDDYVKTEIILPSIYEKDNGRVVFLFRSVEENKENTGLECP